MRSFISAASFDDVEMKRALAGTSSLGWIVTAGLLCSAVWLRRRRRERALSDELGLLRDELEHERSEREAVARRAAHDLRNALTPIRARAELLTRRLADHPEHLRHSEAILRSVVRADVVIQKFAEESSAARRQAPAERPAEGEPMIPPAPTRIC